MSILTKLIGLIPGGNLIALGIEIFEKLSKILSGDAAKNIEKGLTFIKNGLDKAEVNEEEKELLSETLLKLQKMYFQDAKEGRDLVKLALSSDDPVVRQARPRMMIFIGKAAVYYVFTFPVLYIILAYLTKDPNSEILKLSKELILWGGGFLISAFMTSFTGYTVARSMDKRGIKNIQSFLESLSKK